MNGQMKRLVLLAGLGRDQIAEVERIRDCVRGNFQRTEKGAR